VIVAPRQISPATREQRGALSQAVRGFSLIELMTVLGVVAILMVVAAPSYSVLMLRTKLKSYANDVVASAFLARSEAIKRNVPVRLCIANTDGDDCVESGNWNQGWIVIDDSDTVIRRREASSGGIFLFELSSIHTVTFQPTGTASNSADITICRLAPDAGIEERKVTISSTGRPRVETVREGEADFIGCSP